QPRLPDEAGGGIASNGPGRLVAIQNLAGSHDDAHMLLAIAVQLLRRMRHTHVLLLMYGLERAVRLILTHEVDQATLDFLTGLDTRNEPRMERNLRRIATRGRHGLREVVDVLGNRIGWQLPRARHGGLIVGPQRVQVSKALFLVLR